MVEPIPKSVRSIWDDWNIRVLILSSLSLQTFLILCAPIRKRTSNMWIMSLIWSAYLLADWVANFAIGLIASSQGGRAHGGGPIDVQLLAFWAPFLLIHLGGPDTIISFSLEDNAFWLRHLLGLLFQIVATLYVFLQSLGPNNKLWFATLVLFLTGIIKYAERTRALYLGSLDGLKISVKEKEKSTIGRPPPIQSTDSGDQVRRHRYEDRYHNIAVVRCAYDFFELSRGLLADLVIRDEAAMLVLSPSRSPEEAFHIIAVELNFIYETLFTKLYVAHTKLGYFFRATSFGATSIALVFFYKFDKHGLHRVDVVISYTLLFGAMALDSIAFFMLIISDWTVPAAKELLRKQDSWQSSCVTSILLKYLDLKSPKWSSNTTSSFVGRSRQNLFGRCSQSIYTFNFINYALKESPKETPPTNVIGSSCRTFCLKTVGLFGLEDLLDKINYRSSKPLSKDLWNFVYNDLREKAMMGNPSAFSKQWEARVGWIRDRMPCNHKELSPFFRGVDYQRSLLLWHIATELCYSTDGNAYVDNGPREYSKTLSDYMSYLLFMQPIMMSTIGRVERESVLNENVEVIMESEHARHEAVICSKKERYEAVCRKIIEISPNVKPEEESLSVNSEEASSSVKTEETKSRSEPPLFMVAGSLAKELIKLGDEKWDIMSQVWVQLLSYAASNCRSYSHAQSLSTGGELLTVVWFALIHMGIQQDGSSSIQIKFQDRSEGMNDFQSYSLSTELV